MPHLSHPAAPAPTADDHAVAGETGPDLDGGGGRVRFDPQRDHGIVAATHELLADVGYDRLTMDAVAARARASKATLYRRWTNKVELVLDAVSCLPVPHEVPDTGSLAGDLRAALEAGGDGAVERTAEKTQADMPERVMRGLVSSLHRDRELAEAFRAKFVAPRRASLMAALQRAQRRGEIPEQRDLHVLADLPVALMLHRILLTDQPIDDAFKRHMVEEVIVRLATAPAHTEPAHTEPASAEPISAEPAYKETA